MEDKWLGSTAACKKLGIQLRTLYRLIDDGQLAAHRMGRVIRIKDSDIDSYIEGSVIQPGSLKNLYPRSRLKTNCE
jgi:excisionase family DNA binding protein